MGFFFFWSLLVYLYFVNLIILDMAMEQDKVDTKEM